MEVVAPSIFGGTVTEPLPLNRAHPLRGRELRHAALVVLKRWGPGSISQVIDTLSNAGFTVAGDHANKVVSDALRHEVRLGRLRRVGWGRYAVARLAGTTWWRVRNRFDGAIDDPEVEQHVGAYRQPWTSPPRYFSVRDRVRWANFIATRPRRIRAHRERVTLRRLVETPQTRYG